MWMMEPPPARTMCGIAQRLMRKAPPRLVAKTLFQAARSRSSTVAVGSLMAAPFRRMSMRPKALAARSTADLVSDSEETSQAMARAPCPASRAVSSAFLRLMSRHATLAPARAKVMEMARQMPPPAPVTIAALPLRLFPSKVGLLYAFVLLERGARPARDDGSGLQHIAAARGLEGVAGILLDEQDAGARGVHGAD